MIADPVDDVSCAIGIAHDTSRGASLTSLNSGGCLSKKLMAALSVVARAGDRLRDLVRQRGGQFSHYAQAVHVREIGFQLALASARSSCARLRSVTSTAVPTNAIRFPSSSRTG